jgi:mono/diheme cytochrome c family protein
MIGWNALYANNKPFVADTSKSVEYNRGRYLVDGLAHCTACHTPRTFLMGEDLGRPLGGGSLGSWYAPNISADKANGIGGWSDVELYTYLKTGHATGKGQAAGPMAEAVENSLQHLNDTDLRAIVTYLKQTPAVAGNEAQPRYAVGLPCAAMPSRTWTPAGKSIPAPAQPAMAPRVKAPRAIPRCSTTPLPAPAAATTWLPPSYTASSVLWRARKWQCRRLAPAPPIPSA